MQKELFGDDVDEHLLFIDPMALNLDQGLPVNHFASRVNDARKNIENNRWTKADRKRQNCGFRSVRINGWPSVFLETTKDVKKGDELFVDYGKKYGCLIQRSLEFEGQKKLNQNYINEHIDDGQLDRVPCFKVED